MKWFEEHKELMVGSDDEAPGSSYRAIAKIADEALGGQEMIQFVRKGFLSQKAFGEFLGVGESTVAGWMKSGSFPDYAKRATLLVPRWSRMATATRSCGSRLMKPA